MFDAVRSRLHLIRDSGFGFGSTLSDLSDQHALQATITQAPIMQALATCATHALPTAHCTLTTARLAGLCPTLLSKHSNERTTLLLHKTENSTALFRLNMVIAVPFGIAICGPVDF
jgi:Na+/H+ antiporter NhaC